MSRTVVLAVLLGMTFSPAPAAVAQEAPAPTAAAKKKPKKCKKGKVREKVKVGKRTRTRCVKAKKAWPAPKAVDMRTVGTSYVLDGNYAKIRDRRGRKAKSLPKLLKRIHPRAEQSLEKAAKAGLARMDARASTSQAGGCGGPSATVSSTFNAGGGQSVDLTMSGGPDASLTLGLESASGNKRARVEIEFPGCESHDFESCPTSEGIIRGKDNRKIGVKATLTEGGTVVWSQGIKLDGETTFRGVVQDDASLDFFEPHNTEVGTLTLGGTNRGFAPISIRMLVQRITRVEYPERTFTIGPSTINATISSPDLSGAELTATERVIERGMRQQADNQFRDIIAKAITRFDKTEEHWKSPNNCASIEFTPASNARPLRAGDTGSVSANLKAQRGGSPPSATWTHMGASNGNFTPGSATSVPADFTYGGIVQAGPGILVTGAWKAVSRAGVAQGIWTQPTESSSVGTIAGTFNGRQQQGPTVFNWTGTATYTRTLTGAYRLQNATYTVVASGKGEYFPKCNQSGTKTVTLAAGELSSLGMMQGTAPPFDYEGSVLPVNPHDASMMVNLTGCDPPNPSSTITSLAFTPLKAIGRSPDGIDFSGTRTESYSLLTWTWGWAMTGTP